MFYKKSLVAENWVKILTRCHKELLTDVSQNRTSKKISKLKGGLYFTNKRTPLMVLLCEFSQNTFFTEHLWATIASELLGVKILKFKQLWVFGTDPIFLCWKKWKYWIPDKFLFIIVSIVNSWYFYSQCFLFFIHSKISHWRCSIKKLFLKISQYSQENICAGASS